MTDAQKHTSLETDPVGALYSPSKRQKLETGSFNVELEQARPEALSANPTMGADCAHELSIASHEEYTKDTTYGITEFVSTNLLGFSGILKKRYAFSDCCR